MMQLQSCRDRLEALPVLAHLAAGMSAILARSLPLRDPDDIASRSTAKVYDSSEAFALLEIIRSVSAAVASLSGQCVVLKTTNSKRDAIEARKGT